jgi:hypothetical protein
MIDAFQKHDIEQENRGLFIFLADYYFEVPC